MNEFEVNESENNEKFSNIEKPKKKRQATEKQIEHLKKIRNKKQVIIQARNLIEKEKVKPKENNINHDYSEILKLSDDIREIKEYVREKKNLREQKQKEKNSVAKDDYDEEKEKLREMLYKQQVYNNFIRNSK